MPVVLPAVATPASLLLQEPPGVLQERVTDWPVHALGVPVTDDGSGFTVIVIAVLQPVPNM